MLCQLIFQNSLKTVFMREMDIYLNVQTQFKNQSYHLLHGGQFKTDLNLGQCQSKFRISLNSNAELIRYYLFYQMGCPFQSKQFSLGLSFYFIVHTTLFRFYSVILPFTLLIYFQFNCKCRLLELMEVTVHQFICYYTSVYTTHILYISSIHISTLSKILL